MTTKTKYDDVSELYKDIQTITIHTEGWYDGAHHLDDYSGACKNLHGHTYKCEVWVKGTTKDLYVNGILWDFGNLKKVIKLFDHNGNINNIIGFNSTAEHQAIYIYKELKKEAPALKFKVRVYEQLEPKRSWAEVGDFE